MELLVSIKVAAGLVNAIRKIAKSEGRKIQFVTERVIKDGLAAQHNGHKLAKGGRDLQ